MEGILGKAWVDTIAFTTTFNACLGAADHVANGPKNCSVFFKNISWSSVLKGAECRGKFREAITLYTGGIIVVKLVTAVFWSVIGAISLLFGSDEPIKYAVKNYIQVASSVVNLGIAIIGCIRPIWAIRLMNQSIVIIEDLDPNLYSTYQAMQEGASGGVKYVEDKYGTRAFSRFHNASILHTMEKSIA